jgi:hypothetical protein
VDVVWLDDVGDKAEALLEAVEVVLVLTLDNVLITLDDWALEDVDESNGKDNGEIDEIDSEVDTVLDNVTDELVKVELWLEVDELLLTLNNWVLEEEGGAIAGVGWSVGLVELMKRDELLGVDSVPPDDVDDKVVELVEVGWFSSSVELSGLVELGTLSSSLMLVLVLVLDSWGPKDDEKVTVEVYWFDELVELSKREEPEKLDPAGSWLEESDDEVDKLVEVFWPAGTVELGGLVGINDDWAAVDDVPCEFIALWPAVDEEVGLFVVDGSRTNNTEVEDENNVEVKAKLLLGVTVLWLVEDTVELVGQPPIIDGTALTPAEIGTMLLPQFAAWARRTFWLSWS